MKMDKRPASGGFTPDIRGSPGLC